MGSLFSTGVLQNEEDSDIDSFVILEVCQFQETLEECDAAYLNLENVAEETKKGLCEVEPKLHHNQREIQIVTFTGNAFASVGFLLKTVGIVKAIPTFGASLWLAVVGSAFSVGGRLTSTSASMLGDIVQDRTYSQALVFLQNFIRAKKAYIELVKSACEEIQSRKEGSYMEEYLEIVQMMSEYMTLIEEHPLTCGNPDQVDEIPPHASNGILSLVHAAKSLKTVGAEVTLASVAKFMNPLKAVMDVGFLVHSVVELCKNEECEYEHLVDLMVLAIEKDMELMNALHCKLNSLVFLKTKSLEKDIGSSQNL